MPNYSVTLVPIKKPSAGIKFYRQNKKTEGKQINFSLSSGKECAKFLPKYTEIFIKNLSI